MYAVVNRRHAMWPLQLLVLLGLNNVAGSDVVERPTHQVVSVGQDVRFCCRSDKLNNTLRWDYISALNSQHIQLYNGHRTNSNFSTRYSVSDDSDTSRDLDIRSVQPSDAGTYVCFNAGENRSFAATLVVIASEPKCRTSDLDSVMYREVECKVNYTGDWPPSFLCLPPASNPNDSSTDRVPSNSVTYRQRFVAGRTRSADVIECWMYFDYNYLIYHVPTPAPVQKFEYDNKPVAYTWKYLPFSKPAASEGTPVWMYFYIAITATIIVVQMVALAVICSRKTIVSFRRLNDDDCASPVSTAASPEAHVDTSVGYSSILNAEPPVSSSGSRGYDPLLQNTTGPIYAELVASPKRVVSSNSDANVVGNNNNIINTNSTSVPSDLVHAGISSDRLSSINPRNSTAVDDNRIA